MQLSYHWLIVAVGDLMTCVGIGAMLGVAGSQPWLPRSKRAESTGHPVFCSMHQ